MGAAKREPLVQSGSIDWTGVAINRVTYRAAATVYAQGDPASTLMYLERGAVRLSVVSQAGKEAVIAMLERGNFFGEGALAGQRRRMCTATAMSPSVIFAIEKQEVLRQLHERPPFGDIFLHQMLLRNIRIEADLVDQLFNSTEKRLARALLLLSHYGQPDPARRAVPRVSQEILAEMIGTTRTRVNFFMNKFRKLGLIEYRDGLKVHGSLLSVVLKD